jgi:hypothetical protein
MKTLNAIPFHEIFIFFIGVFSAFGYVFYVYENIVGFFWAELGALVCIIWLLFEKTVFNKHNEIRKQLENARKMER